jgi:hypothetical protein
MRKLHMENTMPIRVKAICLFTRAGRTLAMNGNSLKATVDGALVEPGNFYRAIGD